MPPHAISELLKHEAFVRAVVRDLLADEQAVDDVVQQTWFAAMRRGPDAGVSPLPWIRAVARNFAFRFRRTEGRANRRLDELKYLQKTAAVPASDEILEREQRAREVLDCLLSLESPYRETLILKYYEGLSPREISARLRVPVETARTHARRGIEILRKKLDARHGGARETWQASLAPVALGWAGSRTGAGSGVLLMTTKTKIIAILGILFIFAAVARLLWWNSPATGEVTNTPMDDRRAEPAVAESRRAEAGAESRTSITTDSNPARVDAAASAFTKKPGGLRLSVKWADGMPAAGLPISVVCQNSGDPALESRRAVTGGDGMVDLKNLSPGVAEVFVEARTRSGFIVKSAEVTEGEIIIPAGIDIDGIVVDDRGRPVNGAQIYHCNMLASAQGPPLAETRADGEFHLRGIEELLPIGARAAGHAPSQMIQIPRGQTGRASLTLTLPGPGGAVSGIVKNSGGEPVAGAAVQAGESARFWETNAFGNVPARPFIVKSDAAGRFVIEGVAAGNCKIFARAPGFAVAEAAADVAAGNTSEVSLILQKGATLRGKLTMADGRPATRVLVTVGDIQQIEIASRAAFVGAWTKSDDSGEYIIEGIASGDLDVRARGNHRGRASVKLHFEPGMRAEWNATLDPGQPIIGIVRDARGNPMKDMRIGVYLMEQDVNDDVARTFITNEQGRFRAEGLLQRPYEITVRDPGMAEGFHSVTIEDVLPGPEERIIIINDESLQKCVLTGVLRDSRGAAPGNIKISLRLRGTLDRMRDQDVDAATGRFRIEGIPPGFYWVTGVRADGEKFAIGEYTIKPESTFDVGEVTIPDPAGKNKNKK